MATKQKQNFKKLVRTIHLWLGLTSGVVVFVVALSGAMFAFEEEGRETFQHHYYYISNADSPRLPLDLLLDSFKTHYPKEKISSIRFKEKKDAAFIFLTEKKLISMDPTTAKVIGVREKNKDFFSVVQKFHTTLFLGEVGEQIVKINVLIFFLMCISGLILWFPRQSRFFKQASKINWKTKNRKKLIWELHSVPGFYALLVLFIISLTGLFWTFDTAKSFAGLITGNAPDFEKKKPVIPLKGKMPELALQKVYAVATRDYPGAKETFITPNTARDATIRVLMRYPYSIVRKQNTIYYNGKTGQLTFADLYKDYNGYDMIARSNFDFHTGRIRALGIFSKIIWFLCALTAATLPVTGFLIWWGKRKKKKPAIAKKINPVEIKLKESVVNQENTLPA